MAMLKNLLIYWRFLNKLPIIYWFMGDFFTKFLSTHICISCPIFHRNFNPWLLDWYVRIFCWKFWFFDEIYSISFWPPSIFNISSIFFRNIQLLKPWMNFWHSYMWLPSLTKIIFNKVYIIKFESKVGFGRTRVGLGINKRFRKELT